MSPTIRAALSWGLLIGLVNLVWLYLAYYLGLHTSGVMIFQVFMLVWLVLTVAGFVLALRAVRRRRPGLTYGGGLAAGAAAALVSTVVAAIAQVGYYKVVHPEWPQVMAEQTRAHFTDEGLPPAEVEQKVAESREWFTLSNYAISSAATALILGIVLSAVIMLFLRRRGGIEPDAPAAG